ncbi:MAG: tryptophan synthase subunit alpha [Candidatus Omnitrophota bacterium]|nr:tryptophan synthase subunit alpha [Candidatus Omnitrophota bacterium]
MVNRIDKKFNELHKNNKKAFIAYIMAGDPSLAVTKKLILELENKGADIIELGVPFSDPLADGPTIQKASERGLKSKTTLTKVFNLVKKARMETQMPIVLMLYYNLVFHYGLKRFVENAGRSGIDGAIVPDLPLEESKELRDIAKKHEFSIIHLLAPTSSMERIKNIAAVSTGFIYYVSLTGTTGARSKLPEELSENLRKIKKIAKKPVCAGFGISTREQVKAVSEIADGVIVGSAIVKVIERNIRKKGLVKKVGNFVKNIKG